MEKIDLKKIMDISLKKKIHIILIITIFVILGIIYTFLVEKELYVSSTTFLLGVPTAVTEENDENDNNTPVVRTSLRIDAQTVSTYNELVKSNTSISEIKNNLKIEIKDELLKKAITVSRAKKSDVIEISVIYTDKKIASNIANETVKVFSKRIKEIYKISEIYIIDEAIPAEVPYNVNHIADIIIFIILGFLISIGYCLIIFIFDKTIKNQETIEEDLGLRILASIPNRKSKKQALEKLIDFKKEKSPVLEGFENLKMNVQFTNINNKSNKVMLVTSSFSTEGKSYVAANLAAVFAKAGKKVIIIDMDMRAGRQASIFGTPNNLGISNYLSNIDTNGMEINERINSYIKETSIKNLNLITSGSVPPNPSDLLTSEKLPELIKDLSVFYDLIIFDGAPVLPVPDSLILSRMAGSTILVSLSNKTKKEDLRKAKKDLQNIGGRIIGVVFHEATTKDKTVRKAYLKLETQKEGKNKKKIEVKDKILKIKKWILNHIVLFKRKGEQLLLGQKEETQEMKDKQSKEKIEEKEKVVKEEINKKTEEIVEITEIKTNESNNKNIDINSLENEKNINKTENIENIEKLDDKLSSKEKTKSQIKEKLDLSLRKIKEKSKSILRKSKNAFEKSKIFLKENIEKMKKYISKKNEQIKEKQKIKKEAKEIKKSQENKKIQNEKEFLNTEIVENEVVENIENKVIENEIVYNEEKNKDELEKQEKLKQEEINKKKQEEIKLEKAIKKEQEQLEKMQKAEEKKEQKEFLKQEKRQKRINLKKERRKQRREKLKAKQEETRIEEELLEDNLYPKTKHNKNL